jgi:protein-tyrosine phosphatase
MRILTVCLGNICRSPMAEGVLRHLARQRGLGIITDSAGTGHWHVGEPPDPRAIAAMRRQGIDISDLRARQFARADFDRFDLILAMDNDNLRDVLRLAPTPGHAEKASLILGHAPHLDLREVPDPYYGSNADFDRVYRMLKDACEGLLDAIARR